MSRSTYLKLQLNVLADLADAVADFQAVAGEAADGLAAEVQRVAGVLLFREMAGANNSKPTEPEKAAKAEKAPAEKTVKADKAVKAAKEPKAVEAVKAKSGLGSGVCVICGKRFDKRTGVQKTCSPECTAEKDRRYQRDKYRAKAEAQKAPAGAGFRLPPDPIPSSVRAAAAEARAADRMD